MPQVRVVDETGKQLGVMPARQALLMARERGLDLVEVAPAADPPVCRLLDYGRFRYEATRKEREARKIQRGRATNELREIRFRPRIGEHDRFAKVRRIRVLLEEGAKVKVSVMFRGREITHPDLGMNLLRTVAESVGGDAVLERAPVMEGRFLSMVLAPSPAAAAKAQEPDKAPEPDKELRRAEA